DLDSPRNRAIARELAERSVVLLANDGTLPLRARKIALIGPCADDPLAFLGCYSFPNHVLPRHPEFGLGIEVPSLLDDLREELLATTTPVVVVVVSGRPYALGRHAPAAAALIQSFMPGEEGGPALAGVLSGRVVPSGRLPVQVPRLAGSQPGTYLHPPL